jgi:PAS domain-containing protein
MSMSAGWQVKAAARVYLGDKLLPLFKRDPTPLLPILELLKADPSLYVRKSVANNLNDIAKDNPSVVLETARRWKGTHTYTDWIARHACRTLIRKANPEALTLFGYAEAEDHAPLVQFSTLSASPSELSIGENCELHCELHIREGEPVHLRIEYGIDFVKAGNRISRKLFLLSDKTVSGGTVLTGTRIHRWANLTTRNHYPGDHKITLLANGKELGHTIIRLAKKL